MSFEIVGNCMLGVMGVMAATAVAMSARELKQLLLGRPPAAPPNAVTVTFRTSHDVTLLRTTLSMGQAAELMALVASDASADRAATDRTLFVAQAARA